MAKRTFHLNEKEKDAFRQREAVSRDTTEMKRLQAVRLCGINRAVADILEVVGCSESSLRRWVQNYREQGLSDLRTEPVWKQTRDAVGHLWDYRHSGDLPQAFQPHLDNSFFRFDCIDKYLPQRLCQSVFI